MKLLSKIELHPVTLFLFLVGFMTGYVKYMFFIFLIVLIHELGHVTISISFRRKIISIKILPFGGLTVMEGRISEDIFEDLLIAVGGILFQTILGFILLILYNQGAISDSNFAFLNSYNMMILSFNIVPICPLDGYKIIKLLSELFVPYRISYMLALLISTAVLITMGIANMDLFKSNLMIFAFLLFMSYEEVRMWKYINIKFYLERMNYEFNYPKKNVSSIENMFKNKINYIRGEHEKVVLNKYFTMNHH